MSLYQKYFKTYQWPFLISIACVVMESICDLMGPTLLAHMINNGIKSKQMSQVWHWGSLMLMVTFIGAIFAITRNNLSSRVSQRMGADLRLDLFEKVIYFAESSVDQIESGSLITRLTNDTAQVTQFVNGIMRVFMKAPILGIGSIILATTLNPELSLVIYGVVALVTGLIYLSMHLSYPRFYQLQEAVDRVNSKVQEYLIGIRLVKAFGTFDEETEKFESVNQNLMRSGLRSQMVITVISPLLTLVVGMGSVVLMWFGADLFTQQGAEVGDMAAFLVYMAQILFALIMLTTVFNMFVRTKASTQRITQVFEQTVDFSKSETLKPLSGQVSLSAVSFAYPSGSGIYALENVSLEVNAGEKVAIIGPTGSGKSTIAWLLMKFYEVDKGKISIGGSDLNTLGINQIRSQVALVPQMPMLFSGTVRDNLLWGNENASDEALWQALQLAEAGFVKSLPEGLDSLIGSGGVNLSGGQKQRLSIARALLKPSAILVLDDATSALDTVTESKVRRNLNENRTHQTQLIITQRCSTAMSADRILVMEAGTVVGYDTHEALMGNCPVYQSIYETQIEGHKEVSK